MPSHDPADPPNAPIPRRPQRQLESEISALFEEYRSLREEASQRVAARMQLIGFAGIISALLAVTSKLTVNAPTVYTAVLVLVLAVLWLRGINLAIQRIGRHLRGVEARINQLAAEAWGSPVDVLTWETSIQTRRQQMSGVSGWVGRLGGWYAS